ncbi:MAG: thermonuclease family protein [Candidatus Pacebacteria bacterium]|nr:thermonuclease family protein [Candidatus Paceibacterota bacterium]
MRTKLIAISVIVCALALTITGALLYHRYSGNVEAIMYRLRTTGPLTVHHTADGDTITINPRFGKPLSVRLLGINTPELEHKNRRVEEECFGKEAAAYVTKLVEDKVVSLDFDPLKSVSEDHDRLLGYIYVYPGYWSYWFGWGSIDLNLHLIEKGYAEEWLYQSRYTRASEFLAAEQKAKAENVGGWKACPDFKKHPRTPARKKGKKRA